MVEEARLSARLSTAVDILMAEKTKDRVSNKLTLLMLKEIGDEEKGGRGMKAEQERSAR